MRERKRSQVEGGKERRTGQPEMTALRVQSSSQVRRVRPSPTVEKGVSARLERTHTHTMLMLSLILILILGEI